MTSWQKDVCIICSPLKNHPTLQTLMTRTCPVSAEPWWVRAPYHGSPGLEEPVEAELRGVADALAQLVVHTLLVEAQLVQHADEEAVLLLRVVLALVGAVGDPQLVEGRLVAADLDQRMRRRVQRLSTWSIKRPMRIRRFPLEAIIGYIWRKIRGFNISIMAVFFFFFSFSMKVFQDRKR